MKNNETRTASLPTIRRLPLYLRLLEQMAAQEIEYASSAAVAEKLQLDPIVVRKDLAITGVVGRPRLGFPLQELIEAIQVFLGWRNQYDAALVGVGNLGLALLRYNGFRPYGLRIAIAFDKSTRLIGKRINDTYIESAENITRITRRLHIKLAILTVPADVAQQTADQLIAADIRGIWNFTPVVLRTPDHVIVQREDLAANLAILSHQLRF